jgi:deazaflavin-dependent oxidoreductase (nitroreductase family)
MGIPRGFFRPVDYSRRTRYRPPPAAYLRAQWLGPLLAGLGLVPRYVVILEVAGRRSGLIRRTTLVQVRHEGEHYVVALAGESEWVRNVRAAGGRVVLARRHRRAATLVEVPPADRAPVLRAYLLRAGRRFGTPAVTSEARYYFGVSAHPSLAELASVADHYPGFRVLPHDAMLPAA